MKDKIISNIVKKEKLRGVQLQTLETLADAVSNSFGPEGSHTIIAKSDIVHEFTKDGHTIIEEIDMVGIIETTIKHNIAELTRNTVKTVGDGTTSAVIMANEVFKKLCEKEDSLDATPYQVMNKFQEVVDDISKEILSKKKDVTPEDIYRIAYVSTNGNEQVSSDLKDIYEKHGNDVFIDVSISPNENTYLKTYDGVTLETGFSDPAYVNSKNNICSLRDPRIYMFNDPVDTPDLIGLFDKIIISNIIMPLKTGQPCIPTVILVPKISRDASAYMEQMISGLAQYKKEELSSKPPLLVITNIYNMEQYDDVSKMCGCRAIRRYVNPDIQKLDIEKGLAPTLDNVTEFYGTADLVEADSSKTKFINPMDMFDEDGEFSATFGSLVEFLENEIKVATENKETSTTIGKLKRRLQTLKANLVEYFIGGISIIDRDNVRALVEDAVLNCRSAAKNGYGYASNVEGFLAVIRMITDYDKEDDKLYSTLLMIIRDAYKEVLTTLYRVSHIDEEKISLIITDVVCLEKPYNIKTKKFDDDVIGSINTDIMILSAISKIILLMFTANQYLTPKSAFNQY